MAGLAAGVLTVSTAQATPATLLLYKLGANAAGSGSIDSLGNGDLYDAWAATGGFNEGNAAATSLSNSTLDYKNSWADSAANWNHVTNIDVGMYQNGVEVSHMDFSAGTGKTTFFAISNLLSSSYTDLSTPFTGNYFSAAGDPSIGRRWYVNQQWGGCPADSGWWVVEDTDATHPCSWETARVNTAGRTFEFANSTTQQNWASGAVSSADVFAISVAVPEPASIGLFAAGLAGLGFAVRRRRG